MYFWISQLSFFLFSKKKNDEKTRAESRPFYSYLVVWSGAGILIVTSPFLAMNSTAVQQYRAVYWCTAKSNIGGNIIALQQIESPKIKLHKGQNWTLTGRTNQRNAMAEIVHPRGRSRCDIRGESLHLAHTRYQTQKSGVDLTCTSSLRCLGVLLHSFTIFLLERKG